MRILSIAISYCLLVCGFAPHLMWVQRAHYHAWPRYPLRQAAVYAAFAVYDLLLCSVWPWVLPAEKWAPVCIALCYLPHAVWLAIRMPRLRLSCTHRLLRLWGVCALLAVIPAVCCAAWARYTVVWGVWAACGYVLVQLGAMLTYPFEALRNRNFRHRMRDKLQKSGLCVIGITGSAGKTGVKRLLACALGESAFATPGNYNTPMGIALSVRDMPPGKRYFVAEMGVGKPNDMLELLDMVVPHIGVVTCILPQHTAHFARVEDIRQEKCRLLDAVEWGLCHTSVGYPAHSTYGAGGDWWAEHVLLSTDGTEFDICSRGMRHHVRLPLLGRQNVDNAVAAWAVAVHLGVAPQEIMRRWREITPEPHRMTRQLNAAGVWVIDDSYNCNIMGAGYALEYVGLYTGRKVVALSGIDESDPALGLNERLGQMVAAVADIIVIVGDRYRDRLLAGVGDRKQVYTVADTPQSVPLYARILAKGDVLLIMADYPM